MDDKRTGKQQTVSTLNLCLKLYGALSPTGNQCCSPIGLHETLCLLVALCSETSTNTLLKKILGLPHFESIELNTVWNCYLNRLREKPNRPLNINLALFSQLKIEPKDDLGLLGLLIKGLYLGDVISFEEENSAKQVQVNDWIERATSGVMKGIKINLDPLKTLLISVVHFKANWNKDLKWEIMPDVTFHIDNDKTVKTNFMLATSRVEYAAKLEIEAVKLEFEEPGFFLLILLPENITRLEEMMTSAFLKSLEFRREHVSICLPKFVIQSELNILSMLREICPELGDLYIGSKYGTYIDDIKQMNKIDVNEQGAEAVSVTCSLQADGPRRTPVPIMFHADKPFVYLLCQKETFLFAGRLCNPLEPLK